jgi:hypothetical protein
MSDLEFFYDPEPGKDYPGKTKPKNRGKQPVDADDDDWLAGVPTLSFLINGQLRSFYTIGSLARALGRSPVTIRSWEQKGWLPKARYRSPPPSKEQLPGKDPLGKRLYTPEQAACLVAAYRQHINTPKKPDWQAFRQHIGTHYPRQ